MEFRRDKGGHERFGVPRLRGPDRLKPGHRTIIRGPAFTWLRRAGENEPSSLHFSAPRDENEDDYTLALRTSSAICFTTPRAACSTSGVSVVPKLKSRPRMLNRTAFGSR